MSARVSQERREKSERKRGGRGGVRCALRRRLGHVHVYCAAACIRARYRDVYARGEPVASTTFYSPTPPCVYMYLPTRLLISADPSRYSRREIADLRRLLFLSLCMSLYFVTLPPQIQPRHIKSFLCWFLQLDVNPSGN